MAKTKKQHSKEPRNDWHTMFYGALELILDSKLFSYQFQRELTKEPLQIDAIIVKKLRDVEPVEKIAKLFLRENIIEFKGPDDYLSVEDFYKVHAYAYLYRSTTKSALIKEMTLTFVEKRHPRNLIEHLEKELGYRVEWKWPGIYYVHGGHFPVQLIETKLLEDSENIWLKHLDKGLGVEELATLLNAEYDAEKHEAHTRYIKPLVEANLITLQEVSRMATLSLDDILVDWAVRHPAIKERLARELGFIPLEVFEAERLKAEQLKAEAAAEAEQQKTIQKLNKKGWTDMEIAEFMELDLKTIQTYITTTEDG
ncbi:MAG: hypothetical protein LBK00_04770 [Treponema sp.]|jgi:hypothetical protein|nr:hypothetical protein [Treponema sp.]